MVALDGNAIGALLHKVCGTDITAAEATWALCRATGPVAGTVVRCRNCSGVLMVISQIRGANCVDVCGLTALDLHQGG